MKINIPGLIIVIASLMTASHTFSENWLFSFFKSIAKEQKPVQTSTMISVASQTNTQQLISHDEFVEQCVQQINKILLEDLKKNNPEFMECPAEHCAAIKEVITIPYFQSYTKITAAKIYFLCVDLIELSHSSEKDNLSEETVAIIKNIEKIFLKIKTEKLDENFGKLRNFLEEIQEKEVLLKIADTAERLLEIHYSDLMQAMEEFKNKYHHYFETEAFGDLISPIMYRHVCCDIPESNHSN